MGNIDRSLEQFFVTLQRFHKTGIGNRQDMLNGTLSSFQRTTQVPAIKKRIEKMKLDFNNQGHPYYG